jgi:hypothetical protein
MDMEVTVSEEAKMRSIIRKHVAVSILLGQGAMYAAAYLVFGWPGIYFCAIALLIVLTLWLVIGVEKTAASSRRSPSDL